MSRDCVSQAMTVRATVGPRRVYENGVERVEEGFLTLELNVNDGPCPQAHFDASLPVTAEDASYNGIPGNTLVEAIQDTVNVMIESAFEIESLEWEQNHEMVYVVTGHTGEREEKKRWHVKAFLNQTYAEQFRDELNETLIDQGLSEATPFLPYQKVIEVTRDLIHKDPDFRYDPTTGTKYTMEEIPLDARHVWHDRNND